MSKTVIKVEKIGKEYGFGENQPHMLLRESINRFLTRPFRRFFPQENETTLQDQTFWALKGISFEVKAGETVGIIGPNGAGKSTLLKLISRITLPTEGHIEIYGRVDSLLGVGMGLHREFTGRENIFLMGSILGMNWSEIRRKLDDIISFADVGNYIDTPVKYYSNGMVVRLGFSVAVHLDPEILIIDEVLSVGDAAFQQKCFAKITEVTSRGLAILLVSHNMEMVRTLCNSAHLIEGGRIVVSGDVEKVVSAYLEKVEGESSADGANKVTLGNISG